MIMNKSSFKKIFAILAVLCLLLTSGGISTKVLAETEHPETVQEESGISIKESQTHAQAAKKETVQKETVSPETKSDASEEKGQTETSDSEEKGLTETAAPNISGQTETSIQEENGQAETAVSGDAVPAESESEESEALAETADKYTLKAEGDGYKVSLSFTKEDLPDNVDPEKLTLSVSKVSDYSRTDEGIEPVKKTTITYPSFAVTLKDADGKAVKAKSGKTFAVTVKIPASVLPSMADPSTIQLMAVSGKAEEPSVLAAVGKSSSKAALAVKGKTITVSLQTAVLAAGYGICFDYIKPVPISSTPAAAAKGTSARKAPAKAEAEDLKPVVKKTVEDNGDGTYKITLSVTGKAQSSTGTTKADVIVVYDKSSSMRESADNYHQDANGPYGLVNGRYVQLYTREWIEDDWYWDGGYYEYTEVGTTSTNETLYYEWGWSYYEYSGSRYSGGSTTRASAAKDAVDTLAESLLTDNKNGDVQLSIVTFGTNSNGEILENATAYNNKTKNAIETLDDIEDNQGTNWEAALNDALTKVQGGRKGASKYVIFVSDGNPTFRTSSYYNDEYRRWNPDDRRNQPVGTHGAGSSDKFGYNYDAAKKKAEEIVNTIGADNFFAIGAFGDVSNMASLVADSGANKDNYYDATDSTALTAAFDNIIKAITHAMEIRNAQLTDTVTSLASVGASFNTDSEVGKFTYTKSNEEGWKPKNGATVQNGKVQWNPAADGESLEEGVTYSVSFNVWPSQEAYDLAAALQNGTKKYDDLSEAEKAQIIQKDDGTYALRTNSTATDKDGKSVNQVTYTQVELNSETDAVKALTEEQKAQIKAGNGDDVKLGDHTFRYNESAGTYEEVIETEHTVDYPDPNNGEMPLTTAKVTVKKKWQDANGNDLSSQVSGGNAVFTVSSDDQDSKPITLTLNQDNDWSGTVYLAPGIKVKGEDLEAGHEYTITEASSDTGTSGLTFTYEGDEIKKPMLVDGTFVNQSGEQTFIGVNRLKTSSLILRKILSGKYIDPAKEFSLAVTADDEWKSRLTGEYSYTITQFDLAEAQKEDSDVNDAQPLPDKKTGKLKLDENGQAIDTETNKPLVIKNGWQIMVDGLPQGAVLTVVEDSASAPETDYEILYNGEKKDFCSVTLSDKDEGNTVVITNSSKVKVPDTGFTADGNDGMLSLLISCVLAGLSGAFVLIRFRFRS